MTDLLELGAAVLSGDGRYRYSLARRWGDGNPVVFILLNPSTADADHDDPTIRKCMGFARAWGFAAIEVVNLFAIRSPDPRAVMARGVADPVGPGNADAIERALQAARGITDRWRRGPVVCAWGRHGSYMDQDLTTLGWIEREAELPRCLGVTRDRMPRHPLYVPAAQPLVPYAGPARRAA